MPTVLDLANSMLGKNERINHADVQQYLASGGIGMDPATVAWCAAFVNATLAKAGLPGTGSNMAKSFMGYGTDAINNPQPGDIAVFNRGASAISQGTAGPLGHAGFIESINPQTGMMNVIGGNQGDEVRVRPYSISSAIAIRHPGDVDPSTMTSPTAVAEGTAAGGAATAQPAFKTWMDYLHPETMPDGSNNPMARLFAGENPFGDNPLRSMVFGALGKMFG